MRSIGLAAAALLLGSVPAYVEAREELRYALPEDLTPQQREEAARKQAKLAAEREKKEREVQAETARLGAHRTAEARRLVEMRQAAEQARPKPPKKRICGFEEGTPQYEKLERAEQQPVRGPYARTCPA